MHTLNMFQTTCLTPLTPLPNLTPKLLLKKCTLELVSHINNMSNLSIK